MMLKKRLTPIDLIKKKQAKTKITMLTCYEYGFAQILDEQEIDVLLVGDSLGNVFAGYENTLPVTLEQIIYHTQAVVRGSQQALVVADMPFMSYHASIDEAKKNACLILKEGGAQAVKLEITEGTLAAAKAICDIGIPVMGHLGFTPQTVYQLGGPRVQGKLPEQAEQILKLALELESFGCFALVLELVPKDVAKIVSAKLGIPVIGIGAGVHCDGQVLVTQDMLGMLKTAKKPRFVKEYANLYDVIKLAVLGYKNDVLAEKYPNDDFSY